MSDVKVSVRLRRESGAYLRIDSFCQILIYFLLDKIFGNCFFLHVFPPYRYLHSAPYIIINNVAKQGVTDVF